MLFGLLRLDKSQEDSVNIDVYVDPASRISRRTREIIDRTVERLDGDSTVEYHICPREGEGAQRAARAMVAAEKQGKFGEMQDLLYNYNGEYTDLALFTMARELNMDIDAFERDYESEQTLERLESDRESAEAAGLVVTPGLSIDGHAYTGAWDENAVLEAVKKRGSMPVKVAMEGFFAWGASAALVLLLATVGALLFANLGYHEIYEQLRSTQLGVLFGEGEFVHGLEMWVNDFLMAIFFLLIGLEIKREIISGELSDPKSAAMPVVGALGGMLLPALSYGALNLGTDTINGWGVPMATDIAFTLGLMALLGNKVPLSLKVFISALAVTDDLGAILVIALFYGHGFHLNAFIAALIIIGVMAILNYRKVYSRTPYMFLGLVLWFFVYESGIHATVAGVLTAALIPFRRDADVVSIADQARTIFQQEINRIRRDDIPQQSIRGSSLNMLQTAIARLKDPGYYLEHSLERGTNYFILPLFAFFNTGILLGGTELNLGAPANLGIILGLFVGKPLGIVGLCWIASRLGIAKLNTTISWSMLLGAGLLAGVGFTMSIVVASSAFHGATLDAAKLSILIASSAAAILGLFILSRAVNR